MQGDQWVCTECNADDVLREPQGFFQWRDLGRTNNEAHYAYSDSEPR